MIKERIVAPDVLVSLRAIEGPRPGNAVGAGGVTIGGQITLDALSRASRRSASSTRCWRKRPRAWRRRRSATSARWPATCASGRGAGTTATGSTCFKNGGNDCFSVAGENQFHAIFGGGPSYIVHPSDTAPALVALDADVPHRRPGGRADGAGGGVLHAADRRMPRARTCSATTRCWCRCRCRRRGAARAARYHKVLDREAWTHAVVSAAMVLADGQADVCRTRARRARRCRADSVAAARGRADARRAARSPTSSPRGRASRRWRARGRWRKTPTRFR